MRVVRDAASGIPLRVLIVCVMTLLVISGYLSLRESGLDARLKAVSTYRWIGSIDDAIPHVDARTRRSNFSASDVIETTRARILLVRR